jgi:putative permease
VVGLAIYVVIVPLLVFFFLMTGARSWPGARTCCPRTGRGCRGYGTKWTCNWRTTCVARHQILIVGAVSIVASRCSAWAMRLLGFLVGLSVVIPYVGAVVVTVPVAVVAWFQWGWTPMFGYLMLAYLMIQILDGNVLVPLLFSEANNLHPVAIILAVLVFGSIWACGGAPFRSPRCGQGHDECLAALTSARGRKRRSEPAGRRGGLTQISAIPPEQCPQFACQAPRP